MGPSKNSDGLGVGTMVGVEEGDRVASRSVGSWVGLGVAIVGAGVGLRVGIVGVTTTGSFLGAKRKK